MTDFPKRTIILEFDSALSNKDLVKIRDNLSAVVAQGEFLWLGGDEGTRLHRMRKNPSGGFGRHQQFELKNLLSLPGTAKEEIDIEGLAYDGGYLWLIGSHSAKRKKADDSKTAEENALLLTTVEAEGNRYTLARVPIDPKGEPVATYDDLTASRLKGDAYGSILTKALQEDPHLGSFIPRMLPDGTVDGIPSKDNGFDIEGLAVLGDRVFVGLRGPVLRGWAIVLELLVRPMSDGILNLCPLGRNGEPYLKHFLQLDGLGLRELVIDGDDLLMLAGPSMDLDGPVFIYRWKAALNVRGESLTWGKDLQKILRVPFGARTDHAEGLACLSEAPLEIMLCYDSPDNRRIHGNGREVKVDVFEIR
ncbi:DUF3616 domain-containing protein [Cupriavidus sp. L7L]|uniref:DUF3616 domain-containing protein n=1 Tax=Cupriavidus sp. L7L TaxID=2546443 RepID=UPI00105622BD|nr:DUF3616 domain-containing protein [Cupriavidus sp. L7L]TDF56775.1 DUF3616 domain-containing protein [Cupriavidus sp. L7L]